MEEGGLSGIQPMVIEPYDDIDVPVRSNYTSTPSDAVTTPAISPGDKNPQPGTIYQMISMNQNGVVKNLMIPVHKQENTIKVSTNSSIGTSSTIQTTSKPCYNTSLLTLKNMKSHEVNKPLVLRTLPSVLPPVICAAKTSTPLPTVTPHSVIVQTIRPPGAVVFQNPRVGGIAGQKTQKSPVITGTVNNSSNGKELPKIIVLKPSLLNTTVSSMKPVTTLSSMKPEVSQNKLSTSVVHIAPYPKSMFINNTVLPTTSMTTNPSTVINKTNTTNYKFLMNALNTNETDLVSNVYFLNDNKRKEPVLSMSSEAYHILKAQTTKNRKVRMKVRDSENVTKCKTVDFMQINGSLVSHSSDNSSDLILYPKPATGVNNGTVTGVKLNQDAANGLSITLPTESKKDSQKIAVIDASCSKEPSLKSLLKPMSEQDINIKCEKENDSNTEMNKFYPETVNTEDSHCVSDNSDSEWTLHLDTTDSGDCHMHDMDLSDDIFESEDTAFGRVIHDPDTRPKFGPPKSIPFKPVTVSKDDQDCTVNKLKNEPKRRKTFPMDRCRYYGCIGCSVSLQIRKKVKAIQKPIKVKAIQKPIKVKAIQKPIKVKAIQKPIKIKSKKRKIKKLFKKYKILFPELKECSVVIKQMKKPKKLPYKISRVAKKSTTKLPQNKINTTLLDMVKREEKEVLTYLDNLQNKMKQNELISPSDKFISNILYLKPQHKKMASASEKVTEVLKTEEKKVTLLPVGLPLRLKAEPKEMKPELTGLNSLGGQPSKFTSNKSKYLMVKTNAGTFLVPTDTENPAMMINDNNSVSGQPTTAKVIDHIKQNEQFKGASSVGERRIRINTNTVTDTPSSNELLSRSSSGGKSVGKIIEEIVQRTSKPALLKDKNHDSLSSDSCEKECTDMVIDESSLHLDKQSLDKSESKIEEKPIDNGKLEKTESRSDTIKRLKEALKKQQEAMEGAKKKLENSKNVLMSIDTDL